MLAVLSPGQGAQAPGMLAPWLELDAVRDSIAESSEAAGLDLATLGTTADADTIRDTSVAQPLLVASALAAFAALDGVTPSVVAGHSVGEFAAAAVAGVLSPTEAMRLVAMRGRAMAAAAEDAEPTSMAAVLRGEPDQVVAHLEGLGLTPANMNGAGQIVAAGSADAIARLVAEPPAGARVVELQVAGAFHTEYMRPAVATLQEAAATAPVSNPTATLLSNSDGAVVDSGADALARMVAQVAHPVRWDLCMETMLSLGVSGIIELAPGGVLTGLAKRAMPGVPAVALKTPDDLPAALDLARSLA